MISYPDMHSRSAMLFSRAQRVLPGGNTRITVAMEPYPIYCANADGTYVEDVDGNRFVDFIGNHSSMVHGHSFPPIVDAVQRQARKVMAVGSPTEQEVELAELIVDRIPSVDHLRFCNSGTEAIMFAIRAARAFTGRNKIAKFEGAYHGAYDAVDASTSPAPSDWGPATRPNSVATCRGLSNATLNESVILPLDDVEHGLSILEAEKSDLAAVVIDLAIPRLGYLSPSPEYVRRLAEKAKSIGALIVDDEVYSIRLDYFGAQNRFQLKPDLSVFGKIIGGGLPVGAFGGRADIMELFSNRNAPPAIPLGGTFNANPMTMAAGIAAMTALTPDAYEELERLGTRLANGLKSLSTTRTPIQVVQAASLVSMTFSPTAISSHRERSRAMRFHQDVMSSIYPELISKGLLITPSGYFILNTAMDDTHVDFALSALESSLKTAEPARTA